MKKTLLVYLMILSIVAASPFGVSAADSSNSKAPVILQQPHDITLKEGEYAMAMVAASGDDLTCRWVIEINGKTDERISRFEGADIFTLIQAAEYEKHNGLKYRCCISNEYGEVWSETATVTVLHNGGFTDISANAWYYEDVRKAVEQGIIDGVADGIFAPYENITIGAVIKLAACLNQLYYDGAVTLKSGTENWYDTYVAYAEEKGIILRDEWEEAYDKEATRAEFVWIMYKALPHFSFTEINSVADGAIPDVDIDIGFAGPIYGFYRAGILTGSDSLGTFYPNNPIQRCEAAAILTRMTDTASRKFIVLPAPDLGVMKGPMCWTATDNRFVFITTRENKDAVIYGYFDSEGLPGYITKAELNENRLMLTVYHTESQEYSGIEIDISNLDVDGKVKMRIVGETEWYHYYPAGPTIEDGYQNTH